MQARSSAFVVLVVALVVGGMTVGVASAQQRGAPDDGGPPDDRGPITDPSLVVTNVSVDDASAEIRVTVANPGTQPVTVSRLELSGVEREPVVTGVTTTGRAVTADLNASTASVLDDTGSVDVLQDINFDEGQAITSGVVTTSHEDGFRDITPNPAGVVTSIDPDTRVVQNISELHTRPGDQGDQAEVGKVVRKSIEYVRDPTAAIGDALEGIIVGEQIAPVFAVLVEKTDVVGPGDWANGTVVGSIELDPHRFVDAAEFQVTGQATFLQRHDPGTGTDPTPFKERVSVASASTTEQVVGKISWNTPTVVRTVTPITRRRPEPRRSVWDAAEMAGSEAVEIGRREEVTLRLDLNATDARLAGTPPDLGTVEILDGWLFDEHGNEIAHFLAEPGA